MKIYSYYIIEGEKLRRWTMSDEEILALFDIRSENAIKAMERKYHNYCWKIASNILNCSEDIEECLNDTWFVAWNQIPPVKPRCLSLYLGKIVKNISLNKYDFLHAEKRNCELLDIFTELDELCTEDTVEKKIEDEILLKSIEDFLDKQKSLERIYFIRRYWYGDSLKVISSEYYVSQNKLKVILFRMRKKLRAYLEQEDIVI